MCWMDVSGLFMTPPFWKNYLGENSATSLIHMDIIRNIGKAVTILLTGRRTERLICTLQQSRSDWITDFSLLLQH